MQLVVEDLLCPACEGYVHPFLERCPACGAERASRYPQAASGESLAAAALLDADATQRMARSVALRYTLRSSPESPTLALAAGFAVVAGSLTYRAALAADGPTPALPAGAVSADPAELALEMGALVVRARPSGRTIAAVPVAGILAATPINRNAPAPEAWVGAVLGGRTLLERRPLAAGNLLVTFSDPGSAGQLALANRRGLLAPTARADHYVTLARWIGILAAAAAEARWRAVGLPAYLAELGLGDRAALTPDGGGSTSAATGDGGGAAGVRAALVALEELRAAHLVGDDEYASKRKEILDRL